MKSTIATILFLICALVYSIYKLVDKPKYKTNCYLCGDIMILNFDSKGACLVCKDCQPELKQKLDIKPHKDFAPKKRH